MHEIRFSARSLSQFETAFDYYASISADTADRFEQALAEATEHLQDWPESGRLIDADKNIRKLRLIGYPAALLYCFRENRIDILRTIDLRSDPKHWLD